jgi:hypothetical protein
LEEKRRRKNMIGGWKNMKNKEGKKGSRRKVGEEG